MQTLAARERFESIGVADQIYAVEAEGFRVEAEPGSGWAVADVRALGSLEAVADRVTDQLWTSMLRAVLHESELKYVPRQERAYESEESDEASVVEDLQPVPPSLSSLRGMPNLTLTRKPVAKSWGVDTKDDDLYEFGEAPSRTRVAPVASPAQELLDSLAGTGETVRSAFVDIPDSVMAEALSNRSFDASEVTASQLTAVALVTLVCCRSRASGRPFPS